MMNRQRWMWHLCGCMESAIRAEDVARAEEDERQRYTASQDPLDRLFPQWQQSAKAKSQTFATFVRTPVNRPVFDRVGQWSQAPGGEGFLLTGKVGTGKTHLLRAVVEEMRRQRKRVLYTSVPFLLERLRDQRHDAPTMSDVLHAHVHADVVVWDDLGAERPTEWTLDRLYLLLDARYEAEKPLIATTNLLLAELEANLGARITSRLLAMGPVWEVPGTDYRIHQAKARLQRPS